MGGNAKVDSAGGRTWRIQDDQSSRQCSRAPKLYLWRMYILIKGAVLVFSVSGKKRSHYSTYGVLDHSADDQGSTLGRSRTTATITFRGR